MKAGHIYCQSNFFRKIVNTDGNAKAWTDEDDITYVGVIPFPL